jgi:hypothetical protein
MTQESQRTLIEGLFGEFVETTSSLLFQTDAMLASTFRNGDSAFVRRMNVGKMSILCSPLESSKAERGIGATYAGEHASSFLLIPELLG